MPPVGREFAFARFNSKKHHRHNCHRHFTPSSCTPSQVECKIFLEFSKTVASLPDKECPGLKPPETDLCVEKPSCSGDSHVLADSVSLILTHDDDDDDDDK